MERKSQKLVLKTGSGDVVRLVQWPESNRQAYIVKRADTGRVEIKPDLVELQNSDIPFETIKQVNLDEIQKGGVSISPHLNLAIVSQVEKTELNVVLPQDNEEEQFKKIMTWTGGGHIAAVLLVLLVGYVIEPFFKPEEVVVKVVQQKDFVRPQFDRKTVKMSETKIDRTKPVTKKVVDRPVTKPKNVAIRPKTPTKNKTGQQRTKVNVANTGALGVLGGMANGSKNSSGLNLNSMNNSRGSGVSGAGGAGGNQRALPGKGLVASGVGSGGKAIGSGGYGTRGTGGGRPGYGKMSMVGSSGAYFQPLEEEALVQGGLDRDQIHAVIQKNMGQIVYCYEKGLQVNPDASGRVDVRFIIGGSGRVATAKVASSSVGSSVVDSCIVNKLSGWKFPKPHGNVNVQVSYPFQLRRVGQG